MLFRFKTKQSFVFSMKPLLVLSTKAFSRKFYNILRNTPQEVDKTIN